MSRVLDDDSFDNLNEFQRQRLERDWLKNHSSIKKQNKIEVNSGHYWAGSFIYKTLKTMIENRKLLRRNEN